jgi:hypothetical protein
MTMRRGAIASLGGLARRLRGARGGEATAGRAFIRAAAPMGSRSAIAAPQGLCAAASRWTASAASGGCRRADPEVPGAARTTDASAAGRVAESLPGASAGRPAESVVPFQSGVPPAPRGGRGTGAESILILGGSADWRSGAAASLLGFGIEGRQCRSSLWLIELGSNLLAAASCGPWTGVPQLPIE